VTKQKRGSPNCIADEGRGEDFFVRVSVVSGGCSGLTYKMDFDNEVKQGDQVFEDKEHEARHRQKKYIVSLQYYTGFF